jgi:glycosyltransferase involved in cell wall biosynthesis
MPQEPEPSGQETGKRRGSISVSFLATTMSASWKNAFDRSSLISIPDDLLALDDGSKNGSPEVIERVLHNYPFPAELVARPWRGFTATLNEGLEGGGEYFAYMNADDMWQPKRLEVAIDSLQANPTP